MSNQRDFIPGIGIVNDENKGDLIDIPSGGDGLWQVGRDGVRRILTPLDRIVEFIVFADQTLCFVKSSLGHPAIYQLRESAFQGPASAVLMDLDGTSVNSEPFWLWIIERITARLLGNPAFQFDSSDEPFVTGHSVSEHLQYCLAKYCPDAGLQQARRHYVEILNHELAEIAAGRGRQDAFAPLPGLKEFLQELKGHGIKVALVTSGLYEKAGPTLTSVFRTMGMGDPLEFYDAIISAGTAVSRGQFGTIGELAPKPHPWLYAEAARMGLGIEPDERHRVIGIEDSSAGIVSLRLAGFAAIGVTGGNIAKSGIRPLLHSYVPDLLSSLPAILRK